MDNNIYELHIIYDTSFNKLTEKYYRKQPWPEAEVVAPLVNDGKWRMAVKHAASNSLNNRPNILNFISRIVLPPYIFFLDTYFRTSIPFLRKLLRSFQLYFE